MSYIFMHLIMHNYQSNQSLLMTRFASLVWHFSSKLQTSLSRNATRAGSEEGWLFSQPIFVPTPEIFVCDIVHNIAEVESCATAAILDKQFQENEKRSSHIVSRSLFKCSFFNG